MRKIVAAAIRKDDKIYEGKRHHEIINSHPPGFFQGCHQGFVTNDGFFVTREEAAEIAFLCGQLRRPKRALFSEDLW